MISINAMHANTGDVRFNVNFVQTNDTGNVMFGVDFMQTNDNTRMLHIHGVAEIFVSYLHILICGISENMEITQEIAGSTDDELAKLNYALCYILETASSLAVHMCTGCLYFTSMCFCFNCFDFV